MTEDCRGCSGRCCYGIVVHVTPLDIRRLARAQALDPAQIVEPRAVTASDGPNSEAFGARIDASDRLYRTVLRTNPDGRGACQFLMQIDDANGRCGVYADRPRVCAVYPFTNRNGSIDLRDDARCAPGDWRMARLDYAAIRRGIAVYAAEWHACARIVEVWNAAVTEWQCAPSFDGFVAFADRAAEALLTAGGDDREILERWEEASLDPAFDVRRAAYLAHVSDTARAALANGA